jgi:8-amino-7-oxononanoate synthase
MEILLLFRKSRITEKYNASLIIDEAHAFGVFGYGLVNKFQLQNKVLATVITYGKALGTHGAAVLTNDLVKSYLINFSSTFIYTTSAHDFSGTVFKKDMIFKR